MTSSNAFAGALDELPWLRSFAARLARGDEEEAEDLVQETLVAAWQHPSDEPTRSPRGWLSTVLRNRARLRSRSEIRRRAREARSNAPTETETSDTQLERLRVLRVLVERLEDLPPLDRTIIVSRYFDGLNASEIGKRLDMPAATVRSRLKRSLLRLREELDEHHRGDRATWAVVVALPLGPSKPGVLAMSQSMKVTAAATTAITLGVGLWLVQRTPQPEPTDSAAASTTEKAAARPSLPPARGASVGSVAPRTVDAQPRTAPELIPAAESDDDTPLALAKAARTEAMRHCVVEPSVGPVGVFTMRATIVGNPRTGTTFESFDVLDDRGTDTTFVDCVLTQLEGFSGPAPAEAFREVDTQSTFGARPDEIPEDRWIQTIFGGTATAHLSEIRSCEREAGPTKGAVVVSISLEGDPAASEVKIVQSDVPGKVAECIADEVRSWMLPRLVAEPFDYKFELPIDPAVDGTARAPE